MSTSLVAYPATVNRSKAKGESLSIKTILTDKAWTQYFGALAYHYSTLLFDATKDAHLVSELGSTVYLIDADVVRNLVEDRYKDARLRREAMRLFEDPRFSYAIPVGAFLELIEWLRGYMSSRMVWREDYRLSVNLDKPDALNELARVFDIATEACDEQAVIDRIFSSIRMLMPMAERLVEFFSRPNFKGIVADYDLDDVADLHDILGKIPRPADESLYSRARKDFRDAANLALICKRLRVRSRHPAEPPPSYILITQTRAILELLESVRGLSDSSLEILSRLFESPGPIVEGLYPVLSPRRAFIVEDVRKRYDLGQDTLAGLLRSRRVYDDVGSLLREHSRESLPNSSRAESPLPVQLSSCLAHLIDVYHGEDSFYRELEKERAIEASLRYFERKHRVATDSGIKERIRLEKTNLESETRSFFSVLNKLTTLLNRVSVTSYELERNLDESGNFEEISIHSLNPSDLVLQGERYIDMSTGARGFVAYSVRWQTSCTEHQFFHAIDNIIRFPRDVRGDSRLSVTAVADESELPSEGLIIFSNVGVFWTGLGNIARLLTTRKFSISDFVRVIESARKSKGSSIEVDEIEIKALRVMTGFGDFQLDVLADDDGAREVFVISHFNIGEQISFLCEATSLYGIMPQTLNDALQRITNTFPRFSKTNAGE